MRFLQSARPPDRSDHLPTAQWLALPLILLLFLQWPLRDIVRCCSREANDLGQIIFALFVAVSVTAATRAGTHLASDALAHRYSARTRHRLRQLGAAIAVLPWALVHRDRQRALRVGLGAWAASRFADTFNPGYFIIKAALWLMAILMIAQAIARYFPSAHSDDA